MRAVSAARLRRSARSWSGALRLTLATHSLSLAGSDVVKITGGDRFEALLRGIDERTTRNVGKALKVAGQEVEVEAALLITTGTASAGRHFASAPGTAPNNDSGTLARNIETVQVAPLKVEVSSNAPYAAIQEYGGTINHPGGTPYFIGSDGKPRFVSKGGIGASHNLPVTKPHTITLPERPYMRPALANKKQRIRELIKMALRAAIKARGSSGN